MAASPSLKIYTAGNAYEGCCKSYEVAAAIVGVLGPGATIRLGHQKSATLWTEGAEGVLASESYDECAHKCVERVEDMAAARLAKLRRTV